MDDFQLNLMFETVRLLVEYVNHTATQWSEMVSKLLKLQHIVTLLRDEVVNEHGALDIYLNKMLSTKDNRQPLQLLQPWCSMQFA